MGALPGAPRSGGAQDGGSSPLPDHGGENLAGKEDAEQGDGVGGGRAHHGQREDDELQQVCGG